MLKRTSFLLAAVVSAAIASTASGQTDDGGPDLSKVHMRIGPVWLSPTLALTNLGVDNNVFNQPTGQTESDLTMTITPQTDLWLRMGPTWVSSNVKEDIIWYKKFTNQRAANNSVTLGWNVPLNRLAVAVSGTWLNAKDRPGYEIDLRARRKQQNYAASADLRFLSRTSIGVAGSRQLVNYDQAAVFLGASLRNELNRTTTTATVTVKHQLTPLTTLTFTGGRSQDRFEFSSLRDSDSTVVTGGVSFAPAALLKGSATFGYRDFRPLRSGLPSYRGSTAAVNLAYVFLDVTQITVQATRDVQYSYDVNQPYYLENNVSLSVTQQIFGPIDIAARLGAGRLDYRDRVGAIVQASNRHDYVRSYGGSVGYHLSSGLRIAVNADDQKRTSQLADRQYDGLRIGTSATYTF